MTTNEKGSKGINTKVTEEIALTCLSFSRKIRYDYVSSFSGHAALFILMSFFPMMMYIVSMVNYLPIAQDYIIDHYLTSFMPASVVELVKALLEEAKEGGTTTLKSFALIGTLICAAKGLYAIIIGLNAVYGIRETRNFFVIYGLAVVYVLIFFCIFGLVMVLIVFGNVIYDFVNLYMPHLARFEGAFFLLKYITMLILLIVFYLIMYLRIPNRKSKVRHEIIGAFFSAAAVLVFSWAFSFYVDSYANYTITYGSLASMIVFMLWIYGIMYITFIGAEINGVLKKCADFEFDYRRTYEFFKDEYKGDLVLDKDMLFLKKATDTINKLEKKGE